MLMVVPVPAATLHQAGAVILLTVLLVLVHYLSAESRHLAAKPPPAEVSPV